MNKKGREILIFIEKCKKYNRYNMAQERILCLSTDSLYLISGKKIHSQVAITDLNYIVKAFQSLEMLLSFAGGV